MVLFTMVQEEGGGGAVDDERRGFFLPGRHMAITGVSRRDAAACGHSTADASTATNVVYDRR
jgi:hypothetical protein